MPPPDHLPRPPIAYYLLDSYGAQPRASPVPRPPAQDELQSMRISLTALANSATRRARIAADAVRAARDSLARTEYAYKLDEGEPASRGKRGRVRDDRAASGAFRATAAVERRKDGSIGMPKVKRELSASPAPTSASEYARPSSRLGTPADIPASADRSIKLKKRKVAHLASPEADHASPSSTREGSVSADRTAIAASSGTPASGTYAHPERASSVLQPVASGLKVKLSLSNSGKNRSSLPPDSGVSPVPRQAILTGSDSPVQQLINFSLPPSTAAAAASCESLVPVRPPIPAPPKPLPKRQKDVNQDFSTVKHVTQSVQWTTFWNGVEPYLKDFGEEELAMLGFRPEDVEPFLIPPLGKHYQDIWDEEDSALPFAASSSATGPPAVNVWDLAGGGRKPSRQVPSPAALSRERTYVPVAEMVEEDLWDEAKGLGGLNERAVAALLQIDDPTFRPELAVALIGPAPASPKGKLPQLQVNGDILSPHTQDAKPGTPAKRAARLEDEEEHEASSWPIRPHRIGSPPKRGNDERERASALEVEVGQWEQGVAREMRLLGLLDAEESVDWSAREDDEISCALRSCQRLLKTQVAVNNARKDRLLQVTKERLAYSEYKKVLEGLEKLIEQAWTKRYAALKKAGKKQKGKAAKEQALGDVAPGSTGLTPSKRREGVPPLSDQVKLAMSARRRWLDTVGHALEHDPVVGRYRGLPQKSIYEGIDERGRETRPLRVSGDEEGSDTIQSSGIMEVDG